MIWIRNFDPRNYLLVSVAVRRSWWCLKSHSLDDPRDMRRVEVLACKSRRKLEALLEKQKILTSRPPLTTHWTVDMNQLPRFPRLVRRVAPAIRAEIVLRVGVASMRDAPGLVVKERRTSPCRKLLAHLLCEVVAAVQQTVGIEPVDGVQIDFGEHLRVGAVPHDANQELG